MSVLCTERGVSLVEVLTALTLFAIVAAGLTVTTVSTTHSNTVSKTTAAASALVNDEIEQLRALDPATNPAALTAGTHSDPSNPLTGSGAANGSFTRTWTVTANTPGHGLSEVAVSVSWNGPTPGTITGVTYVCSTATCS